MRFENGDRVRITGNTNDHEFRIGEIVTITHIDRSDNVHECKCERGQKWWVKQEEMEPETGGTGLARITDNDSEHGFDEGEIVKVSRYDDESDMWICFKKDGSEQFLVDEVDMEFVK